MIRRACAVLAVAILGCLMLGTPAHAKGPSSATVSGPGMEPQTVRWQYRPGNTRPNLDELTAATGLFRVWPGGRPGKRTAPDGDLGPRYTVVYKLGGSLRQHLYPLASSGELVFTPRQMVNGEPMRAGWRSASGLDAILTELGADLDRAAALTADRAAPADHDDATAGAGGWLVPWGLVAVVAGGLVAASAVRGRLTSRPARPTG